MCFSLKDCAEHNVHVVGKKYIIIWIKIYFLVQQITPTAKENFLKTLNDSEAQLGAIPGYPYVLKQINEAIGVFKHEYIIKGSNKSIKNCCSMIFKQMSKYPVLVWFNTRIVRNK